MPPADAPQQVQKATASAIISAVQRPQAQAQAAMLVQQAAQSSQARGPVPSQEHMQGMQPGAAPRPPPRPPTQPPPGAQQAQQQQGQAPPPAQQSRPFLPGQQQEWPHHLQPHQQVQQQLPHHLQPPRQSGIQPGSEPHMHSSAQMQSEPVHRPPMQGAPLQLPHMQPRPPQGSQPGLQGPAPPLRVAAAPDSGPPSSMPFRQAPGPPQQQQFHPHPQGLQVQHIGPGQHFRPLPGEAACVAVLRTSAHPVPLPSQWLDAEPGPAPEPEPWLNAPISCEGRKQSPSQWGTGPQHVLDSSCALQAQVWGLLHTSSRCIHCGHGSSSSSMLSGRACLRHDHRQPLPSM